MSNYHIDKLDAPYAEQVKIYHELPPASVEDLCDTYSFIVALQQNLWVCGGSLSPPR